MHWCTRAWTALVVFYCTATITPLTRRPAFAEGTIRVLAFPGSSHVPIVHPAVALERLPEPPDVMACVRAMSYTCIQRKTAVYLDSLNRMDRIRLLGDIITVVRTKPFDARTPAINERLLDARGHNTVLSLSVLVDAVVRDIFKGHVLRISFPNIAGLGAPYGYPVKYK